MPRRIFCSVLVLAASLVAAVPASAQIAGTGPGSVPFIARDTQNIVDAYGRQHGANGQLTNPNYHPALVLESTDNGLDQLMDQAAAPNRLAITPGNVFPGWNTGNPLRRGWSGQRGLRVPVSYTNRYGALIRGNVFAPLPGARDPYTGAELSAPYPGVVITTGSVQGSEHMYWWLAEDLAERGYVVLTYDVQGQGTSETLPHQGSVADLPYCDLAAPPAAGEQSPCPGVPFQQTSNFVYGTEDAIDFFLSTPSKPYPNPSAGSAQVNAYNPVWTQFDRSRDPHPATPGRTTRLAIAGHSLGALAVSYVQAVDRRVAAVVALDKLSTSTDLNGSGEFTALGALKPVVPSIGVQSEYGFTVAPYFANSGLFDPTGVGSPNQAPDPYREEKTGYQGWKAAGVDSMVIVPRASTHLEYTDISYVLPASRYGQDVASHYAQAWLDKYVKHDPTADAALLATTFRYLEPTSTDWRAVTLNRADRLSFYFCSGYDFTRAGGGRAVNDDIAGVGCS